MPEDTFNAEPVDWVIPLGSGDTAVITYRDAETKVPFDLTGYTIELFLVHADLAGNISSAWVDQAGGKFMLKLESLTNLVLRRYYSIRVRLIPPSGPDNAVALPEIRVVPR